MGCLVRKSFDIYALQACNMVNLQVGHWVNRCKNVLTLKLISLINIYNRVCRFIMISLLNHTFNVFFGNKSTTFNICEI